MLLLAALCTAATALAYHFQSGDLYYSFTSDNTVEVTCQEFCFSTNYQGLSTATIPETVTYNGTTYSVTSIGYVAFWGCSSLTSIILPNSVTSIRDGAFQNCSSLTDIYCYATTPPVCGDVTFDGVNKKQCSIHVPAGTIRAYRWAHMWKKFYNLSEISEETAISNK